MTNLQVLNEVPLTMAELKGKLEEVKKRDKEFNEKSLKTHDYLTKFIQIKEKETLKIKEEILKLNIPRLKEKNVIKIVDLLPKDVDSLKLIFSADSITVKQEDLQRILETLK